MIKKIYVGRINASTLDAEKFKNQIEELKGLGIFNESTFEVIYDDDDLLLSEKVNEIFDHYA